MSKKLKKRLWRILAGAALFIAALCAEHFIKGLSYNIVLALYLAAYFAAGSDVVRDGVQNIVKGRALDEKFLMLVASLGAFFISECSEGVAVMLFYQIGEWFQSYAVGRSRKSISELMDIRPDYANVVRGEEIVQVSPEEVSVGELIEVKPGERIPLDGIVTSGRTSLDTMALTGESLPRDVAEGSDVISGCVNLTGVITARVTKPFAESTVTRILSLVEDASSRKSESETFISRFARYYTPAVVGLAACLAVVPPLLTGGGFSDWIYRALAFLVVSCPCALVISIPLSFFGGLGGSSRAGILVKGSNYLEALSKVETVVLDKTGTLTKGNFVVTEVCPAGYDGDAIPSEKRDELLAFAALAESASNHPIAKALLAAYGQPVDRTRIKDLTDEAGFGVSAVIDGHRVLAGSAKHLQNHGIGFGAFSGEQAGTIVYVAVDQTYAGYIFITDELREDAAEAIGSLKRLGIKEIVMLTGDRKETAEAVGKALGITKIRSELLPDQKVDEMEVLLSKKSSSGRLAFVGDGMNDAPVLARSDVGIAMGGLGSDAAIEAADVVIMTDEPSKIAAGIRIARRTVRIARENTIFAIGVKAAILVLAAFGQATMWMAVFGDVGVAFLAILNAMRAMRDH
ncbi:MAG: cadmium-translocating P-type ATPase [Lachnospiraceae bacterium]|nr:cadmium-translocating P-type ATPase [Lachnospiraceae bacterium]